MTKEYVICEKINYSFCRDFTDSLFGLQLLKEDYID